MSGTDALDPDDLTAAELAFGLLAGPERSAAQRRVTNEPDFAAAYRWWQERSLGLFADAEATPPDAVWRAIVSRLPANRDTPWLWQAATGIAASIAIVLAAAMLLRPTPPAPVPAPVPVARERPAVAHPLVAILAARDRRDTVAVSYDPAGHGLAVLPSALRVDGHDPELWVIPVGGKPVTLGVVAVDAPSWRAVLPGPRAGLAPGATMAISLEPRGGSPTGQPTGPVILSGMVTRT